MATIVLQNISRRFQGPGGADVVAVRGLDLQIRDGELLVLVGPSGCGKTTTLRLISGLDHPSGGDVLFDGSVVTHMDARDRNVAMVFQSHALYPHMTVRENLESGLKWRKVKSEEITRRVGEMSALLGLKDCLARLPEDLSGGERQRVSLGRSLVLQPKILLLDEPLSHLDAPMRLQLRREIVRLNRTLGITMLYVTHDQSEAMALGGRIAVMDDGVIQQLGTAREIYDQPVNTFVAGFFGTPPMNLIEGSIRLVERGLVFSAGNNGFGSVFAVPIAGNSLEPLVDGEVICGIRPEDLVLGASGKSSSLNGEIVLTEPCGQAMTIVARIGEMEVSAQLPEAAGKIGDRISLVVRPDRLKFFDSISGRALRD